MSRTTESWEALLEGATPGPWRIDTSDPDWPQLTGPVVLEGNLITQEILADVGGELNDPNLHLAAAAPEAVAELVRIRRDLEQMRGWAGNLGTGRPSGTQIARRITHILNQNGEQE